MTSITGIQITFASPARSDQYPEQPATNGTPTSNEAATLIEPSAATLRGHVLAFLRQRAEAGATDEEMQRSLGMNPSTQRPRRVELERAGLILRTADVRKTSSGRNAIVFRAIAQS